MSKRPYLPILELRPAEMLALEELPNKDKDAALPLFRLRPWTTAHRLASSVERLKKAFGARRCFLEIAEEEFVEPEKRRPVHGELQELRFEAGGYQNWFDFLSKPEHSQFIPSLQVVGSPGSFYRQIELLYSLKRGILVRLESPSPIALDAVATQIFPRIENGAEVVFLLDFGKQSVDFLNFTPLIRSLIAVVRLKCPGAAVAVSASSFPSSFTSIRSQAIYERVMFDRLKKEIGEGLIYSDRGGARAEKQLGGGGLPAPRIDYPRKDEWLFFRQSSPLSTPFLGYQAQALELMRDPVWHAGLKLWGSQMIERTASGDSKGGISSPNRSTAARINFHLHRQLYYDDDASFFDTDEEWTD